MIPFVDLTAQYNSIKDEIDEAIRQCIATTSFIKGSGVAKFEKSFAEYIGVSDCISCGNGTDALEMILSALGIGEGDEVIVPSLTWISTAEAVTNVGAEPVFADIDPGSYTIDPAQVEKKISGKTRAVIPVHLYGCPADMGELMRISEKYGLHIVEDCAQAHGAEYNGRKVGTFGIASAFSFFPSKNLGAFGDAGAVLTNDPEISDLVRKISNHGQLAEKHRHIIPGRNSRLDGIQAAILNVKLKYLDKWNRSRIMIAEKYVGRLSGNKNLVLPFAEQNRKHVYHLFVVKTSKRDDLIRLLDEKQISWAIHYPNPIPFTDAYRYKNHKESDFPVAVEAVKNILSLPMYPELTDDQIELICGQILKHHE
jgi:dTDP-4-amino-4,6-dideoxygalactose transaminase